MLSDLAFSDLLLFVPSTGAAPGGRQPQGPRPGRGRDLSHAHEGPFVIVGQVRPNNSQTLHLEDLLSREASDSERPLVAQAWALASVVEGEVTLAARGEQVRLVCIPVRCQGKVVAVLAREAPLVVGRRTGELERVYVGVFDRLARMVTAGSFPFPVDEVLSSEAPRVGDGVMTLDGAARVEFASPNAVNALHRLGVYRGIQGARLDELGIEDSPVPASFAQQSPTSEELERGEVAVFMRCIPLLDQGKATGALVLVRDVTDLRRRDRLLLGKDVAIREVHHRVKNNLQTISSLLRLQSRRLAAGDARHALEEADRRLRSIALVHEILSRDTADEVDFNDILPSLVRMAEDLSSPTAPVEVTWSGEAGELAAQVATPLALVLNELVQNAVEHAFEGPGGTDGEVRFGKVHVSFERRDEELLVWVRDNGTGLPADFSVEGTTSLGLSIVRGIVGSQLGGKIRMYNDSGTVVELRLPLSATDGGALGI
jgi:two-component sensor histidine kinase